MSISWNHEECWNHADPDDCDRDAFDTDEPGTHYSPDDAERLADALVGPPPSDAELCAMAAKYDRDNARRWPWELPF